MSAFTPHPSAPAAVRVIQRTMYFQVGLAVVFGGITASHLGDYQYYQPNKGILVFQFLLAAALLGCAVGVGRLQPWSLPASYVVEIASLALGLYAFADSRSGLSAGFIVAGFNLFRLSQGNVQQALKAGPGSANQYPTQPPYGGQAPYGGEVPYGAPPAQPDTDFYGRPKTDPSA